MKARQLSMPGNYYHKARKRFSHRGLIADIDTAVYYRNKDTDLMKVFTELQPKWVKGQKLEGRIGRLLYAKYPTIFRNVLFRAYKDLGKEWFLDFLIVQISKEIKISDIFINVETERKEVLRMREIGS